VRRDAEEGLTLEGEGRSAAEKQPESRAAHVTAKATPGAGAPKLAAGLGGVLGAAHVQGEARNTRDPSARPRSGQVGAYKAKPKSRRVQRESEGIIVPVMVAQNNAAGGKGPYQRPPVSRVREIRMHGLKGGLALSSVIFTG
jgi:hypothetical protein